MRAQLAFEPDPPGRGMGVVEVGAFAIKAFTPVLLFVSPFRDSDMGLGRYSALFQRVHMPSRSQDTHTAVGRGSQRGQSVLSITPICDGRVPQNTYFDSSAGS